ncbi:hypothetical protein Tco_0661060 [Tanacetum coccineum]
MLKDLLCNEDVLCTVNKKVSTDRRNVSTDRPIVSTTDPKVSTDKKKDSTEELMKETYKHSDLKKIQKLEKNTSSVRKGLREIERCQGEDKKRIDSEIMEKKSVIARLNKVSSPDGDYLVIYRANGNFRAFNYLMEGDLKIMMESSTEGNVQGDFWSGQQDWKIVTWRLYESCGVCILEFEDGIVIHMLVERRYPLSKDLL